MEQVKAFALLTPQGLEDEINKWLFQMGERMDITRVVAVSTAEFDTVLIFFQTQHEL